MKKYFLIPALLLAASVVFAAGSGGFPSKPTFGKVTINNSASGQSGFRLNGHASEFTTLLEVSVSASGKKAGYSLLTNGSPRWAIRKNSDAESSTATGSDFEIVSSNNSGFFLAIPFAIERDTNQVSIIGTFYSSKSCASGYTRTAPNFCVKNTEVAALTSLDATCKLSTALTGVTDATGVLLYANAVSLLAQNAVGEVSAVIHYHANTDTTCATIAGAENFRIREFVATTDGLPMLTVSGATRVMKTNGSGQFRAKINDADDIAVSSINVIGYFD